VSGQLTDLTDFNYNGTDSFAKVAAAVEAGCPTLGNGGRVSLVEVDMNNDIGPVEMDLGSRSFADPDPT
jgi:hypothetical protein